MSSSILFPTNQYTSSSKSSQEIQKLMMFQQSPLEILRFILTKGHPLQLPFAYKNFYEYPNQLLELICPRLPKQDTQNQILIVESLKKLTTTKLQLQQINSIFECVVQALHNWTTINNQHLVEAVDIVIQMSSDKTQVLKSLQKTVIQMGKQSQPIVSKVIAGTLIPVICKYTGRTIKGQMIDIIKRIIADSQVQAKKVWVTEIFPKLLQNLKIQFIQLHLQEKLYETVYDQNVQIGLMALQVILRNTTKFSLQQQGSRIVKLFIDSMTSKNEKIALMATSFMGETFQNLQTIILKSQTHCLKFWKSLIEVAQSKNQKILNNFIFNLPGILQLSKRYHRVDPVCQLYAELFYNTDSDTLLLASYFHQMAQMFPSKIDVLKDTIYTLFSEVFEQGQPSDDSMKILDSVMANLYKSKQVFLQQERQRQKNQDIQEQNMKSSNQIRNTYTYFQSAFNDNLFKYLNFCLNKKNGNFIKNIYNSISQCCDYFSPNFTEISLLPKLYSAIRSKSAYIQDLIKLIIQFLVRDNSSSSLVNNYVSKINVQLSKSTRSHEREAAMLFFYYSSFQFSIDTFQQFKMGQKYLQFNNDKNLKNKLNFIQFLPRLNYFFTRQQKIQSAIILKRFRKDTDPEVLRKIDKTDFNEYEHINKQIIAKSKQLKQKQKIRGTIARRLNPSKRDTIKQLKKEQILKKRVETRSKTKMLIKQMPKKKTPISFVRPTIRKNS